MRPLVQVSEGLLDEAFNYYRLPTHTNIHQHGRGISTANSGLFKPRVCKPCRDHAGCASAGLWAYSGVPDLSMQNVPYIGIGDNVYYDVSSQRPAYLGLFCTCAPAALVALTPCRARLQLPPKARPDRTPAYNNYTYVIEEMHLPGTHW